MQVFRVYLTKSFAGTAYIEAESQAEAETMALNSSEVHWCNDSETGVYDVVELDPGEGE